MLVEIPPHQPVSDFVRRVKGRSSHRLQREFSDLRMFVRLGPLRDLKSGNVGQFNIQHYEIGFVQAREFQRFDAASLRLGKGL
jgi:REP element-mobilizing transposase RayT